MATAKNNPDNRLLIGLAVLGLGAGGWYYMRNNERKKLQEMLERSETFTKALGEGKIADSPSDLAAERLSLVATKSADEAFAEILSELPREDQEGALEEIARLGTEAKEVFEHQTGIDVDPWIEEGTVGGKVLDTTRSGWSYVTSFFGTEAKENPALTWDQYLASLE